MEPGSPQPSYEDLLAMVVELRERVERLEAENAELRRRLGMNSTNSSKPPSFDGLAKPQRERQRSKGSGPAAWEAAWCAGVGVEAGR